MKGKSKIKLALWAVLLMVAIPFSAYGADGQIKITQPTTFPIVIDQPGSYVLTSNIIVSTLNVDGIKINADSVTLDLNGHALIGPGKESGSTGAGIHAIGQDNIAIVNGTVRDFGWTGIVLTPGKNLQVRDMRISSNGTCGIWAESCTITNCMADHNGYAGISVHNHSTITNCVVSYNELGIQSNYSTITNCTVAYNDSRGIDGNNWNTITNCMVHHNGTNGINATYSATITNCTAQDNGAVGISANGPCTVTNCTANKNGSNGIYTYSSATITNCTAENNSSNGIYAVYSATITNCTANKNGSNGIYAKSKCRIEGNNLRDNGQYGLYLDSARNYAIKNVASDNTSGNFYDVGGNYMPTAGDNANYEF